MFHSLIICTKNRADVLDRAITSVYSNNLIPDRIIVIDSSESEETKSLVQQWKSIEYFHSEPGLTHQRNVGLSLLTKGIVHFIDDDVEVNQQYFQSILDSFNSNPNLVGVTGKNPLLQKEKVGLLKRIALLDATGSGKLLKSGVNLMHYCKLEQNEPIDWLPGCSMSFNLSKISQIKFDESRTGYGLGEDVDFSSRAKNYGPLEQNCEAIYFHHLSETNRYDVQKMKELTVQNQWKLALDNVGGVTKFFVVYSKILELIYHICKGILHFDKVQFFYASAIARGLRNLFIAKKS